MAPRKTTNLFLVAFSTSTRTSRRPAATTTPMPTGTRTAGITYTPMIHERQHGHQPLCMAWCFLSVPGRIPIIGASRAGPTEGTIQLLGHKQLPVEDRLVSGDHHSSLARKPSSGSGGARWEHWTRPASLVGCCLRTGHSSSCTKRPPLNSLAHPAPGAATSGPYSRSLSTWLMVRLTGK